MTLNELKKNNPILPLYSTDSPEFADYGRLLTDFDTTDIVKIGEKIALPTEGSCYEASLSAFETLPIAAQIRKNIFGSLPIQVGYCYGYNTKMNAMEWHCCNELNIAVTDLVLILGLRKNIIGGKVSSDTFKAFYVKKGEAIEVYATSLHFCPCMVSENGFGCVVGLIRDTNLPFENEKSTDPLLFKRNKWLIAHEGNKALIDRGVVPGITGDNPEVHLT